MRKVLSLTILGMTLALAGCIQSLHPLYTQNDLTYDPALVGIWGEDSSKETWAFEKAGDKQYKLTYTDSDGKKGVLEVRLVKLSGQLFLDLFPDKFAMDELSANGFYKFHYLPVHTYAKISQIEPTLQMAFPDPKWLDQLVKKNPKAIRHERIGETIVLTATTKELQAFVLKQVKTKEAFGESSNLKRKPAN